MEPSATELERRRKISESMKGRKRPDVAERNRTPEMRMAKRVMSDEGRARVAAAKTKHGHARNRPERREGTKTYYVWAAMVQRCTNQSNKEWNNYGGRGIKVCEWWSDFRNFLADMGEPPEGRSIDRIDNDGNYEPGNCRWATLIQQAANTRKKLLDDEEVAFIHAHPELTLKHLAKALGVGATSVGRARRREGRFV